MLTGYSFGPIHMSKTYIPTLRIRFNWGYHDGAHGWKINPDVHYTISQIGATYGTKDSQEGIYDNCSEPSFLKFLVSNGITFANPKQFIKVHTFFHIGS